MESKVQKQCEQSTQTDAARSVSDLTVDQSGLACFPEGITEIRDYALDGNKTLRIAVLPSTIRRIGLRAFADCSNLEKLVLNEGLEEICSNAFTGCTSLKSAVFPDSLKEVQSFAFYYTYFQEPVLSASGDVLYRWPEIPGEKKCTIPNQIKKIQSGAFLYRLELEEVIIPEGVESICWQAFLNTGIRRLTIPASVKYVGRRSFWDCKSLEEVVILCGTKALETGAFYNCPNVKLIAPGQNLDFEESQRIQGLSVFTVNAQLEVPEQDFWKDPLFASIARGCAMGDANAMMELAAYYASLSSGEFYTSAANFWRYRAYLYGDPNAAQWRADWLREKPDVLIPVALNPNPDEAKGNMLRALGFEFFDPNRVYCMDHKDENGVIEVNSWCSTEDPDEDGFGMEELYDWWYIDAFLNPIPGAKVLNGWSWHSRQTNWKQYAQYREQAAIILHEMKRNR